jgi:hypothetical protein
MIAYSIVSVSALGSVGWATLRITAEHRERPDEVEYVKDVDRAFREKNIEGGLDVLVKIKQSSVGLMEDYATKIADQWLLPCLSQAAAEGFSRARPEGFEEFQDQTRLGADLLRESVIDQHWPTLRRLIEQQSGPKNLDALDDQPNKRMTLEAAARTKVESRMKELWDGVIDPGSGWAQPGPFGFWSAGENLSREFAGASCDAAERYVNTLHLLFESAKLLPKEKEKRSSIESAEAREQLHELEKMRGERSEGGDGGTWADLDGLRSRIEREESLRVTREVLELLENEALREICLPAFLTLDLAQLPKDLRKQPPGTNVLAARVFRERARCAGDRYAREFPELAPLLGRLEVDALGFHEEVSEHLGSLLGALTDESLSEWRQHVAVLLDQYETGLLETWRGRPGTSETELKLHFDHVSPSILSPGREAWLEGMIDLLVANMGSTIGSATGQFLAHSEFRELQGSAYAEKLKDAAKKIRESPGEARDLSARLADALQAAGNPRETGAERFVEKLFEALCEFLFREKIRPAFVEALEAHFGRQGLHHATLEALWGELKTPKLELFDRGGALDLLFGDYRIEVARLPDDAPGPRREWSFERFAGSSLGRDPRYDAVRFLRALQVFLLTNDKEHKSARSAELAVTIQVAKDGAFPENKSYLYVRSSGSEGSSTAKSRKNIEVKWTFVRDAGFKILWSDHTPTPDKDQNALVKSVPGPLAPMVLAWSGQAASDGWVVNGVPEGKGSFALTLVFKPPLPPRPAAMPFSSD